MSFKHTVVMPKMSMTMETGELIGFHVTEGQEVKAGDVLFEVMTDKIDMEVESPADGKVEKLLAAPGAVLEVGKPVLTMETATQVISFDFSEPAAVNTDENALASEVQTPVVTQTITEVATNSNSDKTVKSVPAARKLAAEKGINLNSVKATGPYETITYEDVATANVQIDPQIAKRKEANKALIAKGVEQMLSVPQTSFSRLLPNKKRADLDQSKWHAQLMSAWAKTLRTFAQQETSNNSANSDNLEIGVALIIESKYGSALPVFKNPDLMEPALLTELVRNTTEQARNGKVPLSMLNGATTTIFDLTGYQMAGSKPTLFPNQSTGLTVGGDGELSLALTIDLRALDFYDGAALLAKLIANL